MKRQNRCKIFTLLISMLLVCAICFTAGAEEAGIKIDEENFPDAVFRAEIQCYDLDKDLVLSKSEAARIQEIELADRRLESLQGIEYLNELRVLACDSNKLKTLDLSKNAKLTELYCGNNMLTELDVSNNPELLVLYCNYNRLKTMDLSKNTKLTSFECGENKLTELDVSNNPELAELNIVWNDISSIDTSNNPKLTELAISGNPVDKLDLSNLTDLEELYCGWNNIKELDVSKNQELYCLSAIDCELTELDVSNNPALKILMVEKNKLETLDISKCPELVDLVEKKEAVRGGESSIAAEWSADPNTWGAGFLSLDTNVKLYTGTGKYAEAKVPDIKTVEAANAEKDTETEDTGTYPDLTNDYHQSMLFDFFCKWSQGDRNELPLCFIPAQRTGREDVNALVDKLLDLGTPVGYQINSVNSKKIADAYVRTFQCTLEMASAEGEPARFVQAELGVTDGWNNGIDVAGMNAVEAAGYESTGKVFSLATEAVVPVKLAESLKYAETEVKLQPIGVSCESNGIKIELISGFLKDDNAWFFYTIEDTEGKYGDCTPDVSMFDNIADMDWLSPRMLYHDIKAHKSYHLVLSHYRNKADTYERNVTVSAGYMEFVKHEWMNLSEAIAEHCEEAENVTTIPLDAWHSDYEHDGRALTEEERKILDYRKPLDIEVMPGVSVSGIGWIDGKLHVQLKGEDYYRSGLLVNGVYNYNSDKRLSYSPLCWSVGNSFYYEYVFNCKQENVDKLKLVFEASKNIADNLNHNEWRMQFPLSAICPDTKAEEKPETAQDKDEELPATEITYVSSYPETMHDYKKYTVWEFFCRWAQGDTDYLPYSFTMEQRTGGEETQKKINELLKQKPLSYKVDNTEWSSEDKTKTYYCLVEFEGTGENSSRLERVSFNMVKENSWTNCIDLDSIKFLGRPEELKVDNMISLSRDATINDQLDYFYTGVREKLQPIGKTSECNGIRLEVISGYAEGMETWYLYSLEDLEGKYEDYSMDVWDMEDDLKNTETYQPGVLYRDKAANKSYYMIHLTHDSEIGYEERDVKLTLDNVHFSKNVWADLMPLLKEHMEPVEGVHPTADVWDRDWEHQDKKLNPEEIKVLDYTKPLNLEVVPGEFVTGIGWIDNQLHVQIRMGDGLAGYSEGIYCNRKGSSSGYDSAVPYTPLGWTAGGASYEEYIFTYKPEDVENLQLILNSSISYESEYGMWSVEFPLSAICPMVKTEEPETVPAEEERSVLLELKDGQFILNLDGVSYRLNEDGTATIVKIGKEFGEPLEIPETVVLTFNVNNVEYEAFLDYINKK